MARASRKRSQSQPISQATPWGTSSKRRARGFYREVAFRFVLHPSFKIGWVLSYTEWGDWAAANGGPQRPAPDGHPLEQDDYERKLREFKRRMNGAARHSDLNTTETKAFKLDVDIAGKTLIVRSAIDASTRVEPGRQLKRRHTTVVKTLTEYLEAGDWSSVSPHLMEILALQWTAKVRTSENVETSIRQDMDSDIALVQTLQRAELAANPQARKLLRQITGGKK